MSDTAGTAASNGEPPAKVTDVALPQATQAAVANDDAKPVATEADKAVAAEAEAKKEQPPPPPVTDPLARARALAARQAQVAQQRMLLQEQARRESVQRAQAEQLAKSEAEKARSLQAQLDLLNKDPMAALAHLEKVGLSPKVLAQKAIEANSPEGKLKSELEQRFDARLKEIEDGYSAKLRAIEEREQATQRAQQMQHVQQAFIAEAMKEKDFPNVAQVAKLGGDWQASLIGEAMRLLEDAHRATGHTYTDREVLSYLDAKYAKLLRPQNGAAVSKDTGSGTGNGTGAEKDSAGAPRTLTNKTAQVKGSLPPDWDSLSDREQKAALAAMYRQSRRA